MTGEVHSADVPGTTVLCACKRALLTCDTAPGVLERPPPHDGLRA